MKYKMVRLQPACIVEIYEVASLKLNHFINGVYNENQNWLQEVLEAAKKEFGR